MNTVKKPIIRKIEDNELGLEKFQTSLQENELKKESDLLLRFPTVYIHHWKETDDYEVYVGESNDIVRRTKQHYEAGNKPGKWQHELTRKNASLYIIGHEHFNKSLTMDIENRLMLYMTGIQKVRKIHNLRGNLQNRYYPDTELDSIFHSIWSELRKDNQELFPRESDVQSSALFKASPLHKLTDTQEEIKECILQKIFEGLEKEQEHQLIFIDGEAGTGKTVLNSSTFYEIFARAEEQNTENLRCFLLVNHDEQITVYRHIAKKLGITDKYGDIVKKPTSFINHHSPEDPIDVAFIDEAHLLLTQGKQSYQGKNQLQDIIERAKVTVVMFDENQILTTEQYWEEQILEWYRNLAMEQENHYELKEQLRMKASPKIITWLDDFTKRRILSPIPKGDEYEIKVFETPYDLERAIRKKASNEKHKLSRLIATYDWDYKSNEAPTVTGTPFWEVIIGNWHKPWNRELDRTLDRKTKIANNTLAWAEQPQTIDEVGSTFTIQGFDLNYSGVILGPSVKYREGRIIFDPSASSNKKAIQNRTLSDGSKQNFGEILIQHEVRVLMTRGVEGLYIYACDDALREALLNAAK